MSGNFEFDSTGIEPRAAFDLLPAGKYEAMIIESELRDTKDGDGEYIAFTYELISGDYAKRRVWSNHNITNPSEKAEAIAKKEMSAICLAVGVVKISDTAELHDRPMVIGIGVERGKDGYADKNKVLSWSAIAFDAGGRSQPAVPAAVVRTPGKPTASTPWANRGRAA